MDIIKTKRRVYPALTPQQQENFKKFYLGGDSAFILFKKLGQPYKHSCQANTRMRGYRIKLDLPRREIGWYPKALHRKGATIEDKKRTQNRRRKTRIKKLENMIPFWEARVKRWKEEVQLLGCARD